MFIYAATIFFNMQRQRNEGRAAAVLLTPEIQPLIRKTIPFQKSIAFVTIHFTGVLFGKIVCVHNNTLKY